LNRPTAQLEQGVGGPDLMVTIPAPRFTRRSPLPQLRSATLGFSATPLSPGCSFEDFSLYFSTRTLTPHSLFSGSVESADLPQIFLPECQFFFYLSSFDM